MKTNQLLRTLLWATQRASHHLTKNLITTTTKARRSNWRGLKIGLAVLAGLIVEWLINNVSYPKLDYTTYYVHCILMSVGLTISYFCLMRHLNGSIRLFTLMTFNIISMVFSGLMTSHGMYYVVVDFRTDVFAPAYRLTELIILVGSIRDILCFLFVVVAGAVCRGYAMVTGRRIHI